jgi:hypothetical protein
MASKRGRSSRRHGAAAAPEEVQTPAADRPEVRPRERIIASVACGLASFIVYLATLCPSVGGLDSGELTVVAATRGVAHPPGYPLYTLLAHVFSLFPAGEVAWRVNVFSAACDAFAAALLCSAAARLTAAVWPAMAAGWLFSLSPLVWRYALVAEVFALNNLFVALLFYVAVRFAGTEKQDDAERFRWFAAGALVFALALGNHLTIVFFGAPLFLWAAAELDWRRAPKKRLPILLGVVIAGLLPYLALRFPGSRTPLTAWGDTSTIDGFISHVLRSEYGTFQLATADIGSSVDLTRSIYEYLAQVPRELLGIGAIAAAFGLIEARRPSRWRGLVVATVVSFALYLVIFQKLANLSLSDPFMRGIYVRFWQLPNLLLCIFAALGIEATVRRIAPRFRTAVAGAIAVTVFGGQVALNAASESQRGNDTIATYGKDLLRSLPEGALLLSVGDHNYNAIRYVQAIDGFRRDVTVVDLRLIRAPWMNEMLRSTYPELVVPGPVLSDSGASGYRLRTFIGANIARRAVFMTPASEGEPEASIEPYATRPHGLVDQIVAKDAALDIADYLASAAKIDAGLAHPDPRRFREGSAEQFVAGQYQRALFRHGVFLGQYAEQHRDDPQLREVLIGARTAFERIRDRLANVWPSVYSNLGVVNRGLIPFEEDAKKRMVEAFSTYLSQVGDEAKDAEAIRALLRSMGSE